MPKIASELHEATGIAKNIAEKIQNKNPKQKQTDFVFPATLLLTTL